MKLVSAISILCIAVSMFFTSCINENSKQHSQSTSTDDESSQGIIRFQLDPIRNLATDDPGISFSKLIRSARKDFIDSVLTQIETKNNSEAFHGFYNLNTGIRSTYKFKNACSFLLLDTSKPVRRIKLMD